jgi:hypothetical protein
LENIWEYGGSGPVAGHIVRHFEEEEEEKKSSFASLFGEDESGS